MAFTILAAIVFESATDVLWLALARFIAGFAVGATTSVATAAMSDLEPYRDQHHVARVAVAANFGGFAIGATLSGFLAEYAPDPTRLVYLLPVVASLVGVLAIAATPETASAIHSRPGFHVQRASVPVGVRRPFWVAVGGIAACYSIYGFFAALIPSYVRGGLRISSPLAAAAVVALMFGTAAIAQLGTSQIRDRRALLVGFPLMIGTLVALVLILPLTAWELVVDRDGGPGRRGGSHVHGQRHARGPGRARGRARRDARRLLPRRVPRARRPNHRRGRSVPADRLDERRRSVRGDSRVRRCAPLLGDLANAHASGRRGPPAGAGPASVGARGRGSTGGSAPDPEATGPARASSLRNSHRQHESDRGQARQDGAGDEVPRAGRTGEPC